MIVTIDGPAGSGKSTSARRLAESLGYRFLDTGAMYRVVGLICLRTGIDSSADADVARIAEKVRMEFRDGRVFADGEDVTGEIRTAEVTRAASLVAVNPQVRSVLAARQREIAVGQDIVTEGRDQGSYVFPDAECKFFLSADPFPRALRRQLEMKQEGTEIALEEILEQIRDRDQRDREREVAPLVPAEDAVLVDTSNMTPEMVLELLVDTVRSRAKVV
jgi:cytidylate kinase